MLHRWWVKLVLGGLGCASIAALAWWWSASDANYIAWGTVANVAAAVGTVGATVAAVWIAIRDGRQRERDRKDEQAAQARLVSVEVDRAILFGAVIRVTNHSSAPVFAVRVEHVHTSPDPLSFGFADQRREWARIDPGDEVSVTCNLYLKDGRNLSPVGDMTLVSADVSFVDVNGLRWRRWGNTPPRGGAPITRREPPAPMTEIPHPHQTYG